jgi:hypothetical protein
MHHQITTITIAAYTFTSLTLSIINLVKYKKYNSPIYNTAKTISLIAACVSMITLTTTMLTTFDNSDETFRKVISTINYKKSTIAFLQEILNFYGKENNLNMYLSNLSEYKYPKMEELYETARVSI